MKIRIAILIALAAVMLFGGCKSAPESGWSEAELSESQVAEIERLVSTIERDMTDNDILRHLGVLDGGYIRAGVSGGPHSNYRTTYSLGKRGGLIITRDRVDLKQVEFWNKTTGKRTTAFGKPTTH